jgi:subtilisin family serine protease
MSIADRPAELRRLLVQARPGVDLQPLHERQGNRLLKRFLDLEIDVIEVCPEGEICGQLEKYQSCSEVESVEPDYLVQADMAPNDPAYVNGLLWALHNYGQTGGLPGADLDASAAWEGVRLAGNVIVAVVDSGVRYTHEDLAPNIWVNTREIGANKTDDDQNGYVDDVHGINAITGSGDPMDDAGHGAHIAGIIGAVGNNGRGVAGGRVNLRRTLGLPVPGLETQAAARLSLLSGRAEWPMRFRLNGPSGRVYAIDVSNNLSDWTPVGTNTVWSDGTLYFTDPSPRLYPQHYFSARGVP